jgi:hypothetical protein
VGLKRILQDEELYRQPEDLPWANIYVKSVTDLSITYFVKALYVYESGIMVILPCFKGFIHSGTQLHKHLLEALDVFVVQPKDTIDEMVAVLCKKGKIDLCTDDTRKAAYWMKTENKYAQIYRGGVTDENISKSNPFLAGMGLLVSPKEDNERDEGGNDKTNPKTSRKSSRAV